MMKQIALHLVVMAAIVVTACSPVVYSTVGQNVPLFHQKGEVTGYAGLASTSDANGLALQVAGSTSDHFALMSSFYTMSSKTTEEDNWSGKGSYWEFGLGGFGSLSKSNPNFRFEAFAGLGLRKIENHKADEAVNLKFIKPFIQP